MLQHTRTFVISRIEAWQIGGWTRLRYSPTKACCPYITACDHRCQVSSNTCLWPGLLFPQLSVAPNALARYAGCAVPPVHARNSCATCCWPGLHLPASQLTSRRALPAAGVLYVTLDTSTPGVTNVTLTLQLPADTIVGPGGKFSARAH